MSLPFPGVKMTDVLSKDLTKDLTATLEACAERLRGIRQDADEGLGLLDQALRTIARSNVSRSPGGDLEALLNSHHERVAETILAALQPAPASSAGPAVGFRMDVQERTARIGRRRVPLSDSEFRVMELLWEHRPSPVSRRMLLDHLYTGKDEPTEAVIDLYIFHIRQKLKSAGCVDATIESVRGQGWALRLGDADAAGDYEEAP
jgi:DNA-binding response OmpR family regulator